MTVSQLVNQLVDGTQALDAQERALNFLEQVGFAKVISFAKKTQAATGTSPNEAILQDVPIGQQPAPLHLEAIDVAADATPVIISQIQTSKTVVFHSVAYVSGKEQTVLGFR